MFNLFELKSNPDHQPDKHWHICKDCREPWEHTKPTGKIDKDSFLQSHKCPVCNTGPWWPGFDTAEEARKVLAKRGPKEWEKLKDAASATSDIDELVKLIAIRQMLGELLKEMKAREAREGRESGQEPQAKAA